MQDPNRSITGKVIPVAGASAGIGSALVKAFLAAGAAEVIAAGRSVGQKFDVRVRPIALDVTSRPGVATAAAAASCRC